MEEEVVFETDNLALAAYLKMKGVILKTYDYSRNGNNRRISFSFYDDEDVCKKLNIEFLNSECKKFDSVVRDLKKLFRR